MFMHGTVTACIQYMQDNEQSEWGVVVSCKYQAETTPWFGQGCSLFEQNTFLAKIAAKIAQNYFAASNF